MLEIGQFNELVVLETGTHGLVLDGGAGERLRLSGIQTHVLRSMFCVKVLASVVEPEKADRSQYLHAKHTPKTLCSPSNPTH